MSSSRDAADRLADGLLACGIVTPAGWAEAVARAGTPDARDALQVLSRQRAHWSPEADPTKALTPYQLDRLGEWLQNPAGPFPRDRLVWNGYLLLDRLAAGGMGEVFKGWCRDRRRYVAIKRTLGDANELRARLQREAELLGRLNHPSVAGFYARETFGENDLLVMEFVPGKTLLTVACERHAKGAPVPWESVAGWAVELLDALDHMNGRNGAGVVMIHRDIKPSNVMLRRDGTGYRPVLVDFGLARAAGADGQVVGGADLTRTFQILGTPEYMAPEQWNGGHDARPASDVYGLGGTLYFALTAQQPFGPMPADAANQMAAMMQMMNRHTKFSRPSVRDVRPDVPTDVDDLIRKMLSVDPVRRGEPGELRAAFEALIADPPAASPPSDPADPRPYASQSRGAGTGADDRVAKPLPPPPPYDPQVAKPRPRIDGGPSPPPQSPARVQAPRPVAPPAPAPQPKLTETGTYAIQDAPPRPPTPPPPPGPPRNIDEYLPLAASADEPPPAPTAVEAARPTSPRTAEVLSALFVWLGSLTGPRRAAAPRLQSDFLRLAGAWLRAFARPAESWDRWLALLGVCLLLGWGAGWGWGLIPVVLVGTLVVFALLVSD